MGKTPLLALGDKVALLSENRYEWAFTDFAILALGAVNVPVYPSLLSEQVAFILKDSEAKLVLCSNKTQYEKVEKARGQCPALKTVVLIEDAEASENYMSFDKLLETGKEYLEKNGAIFDKDMTEEILEDIWQLLTYTTKKLTTATKKTYQKTAQIYNQLLLPYTAKKLKIAKKITYQKTIQIYNQIRSKLFHKKNN